MCQKHLKKRNTHLYYPIQLFDIQHLKTLHTHTHPKRGRVPR